MDVFLALSFSFIFSQIDELYCLKLKEEVHYHSPSGNSDWKHSCTHS